MLFSELCSRLGGVPALALVVDIGRQRLGLYRQGRLESDWSVSTSKFGVGSQKGSYQTPSGLHRICEKIGAGQPLDTVYKERQPVAKLADFVSQPTVDLIVARILWLEGCEPGINQGGDLDSRNRYIYIHGTNQEEQIGSPASHGCVRMRNPDVVQLFDAVEVGTPVLVG